MTTHEDNDSKTSDRPSAPPTSTSEEPFGSGLAADTILPTPTGWTTAGAVQPGQQLLDAAGNRCTVIHATAPQAQDCREITLDDNSAIVCGASQVWPTLSGPKAEPHRLTAAWIGEHLRDSKGQRTHRVVNACVIRLPERDLPIHPYVLGAWLGDGKHTSGEVIKADQELFTLIEQCGYEVGPDIGAKDGCRASTLYGLRTELRHNDLLSNKHVPDTYLRASADQRLALLQGLMDTDGSWNKIRGQAVFTNTSEVLAHAVVELVQSLGSKARLWEVQATGFGLTVTCFHVTFSPVEIVPFILSRKADLVREAPTKALRRIVVASEPTISVPTRDLTVNSRTGTYLCGEGMIPTCHSSQRPA